MHSFTVFALFAVLAGQALGQALNIQFGGTLGNITATQMIVVPDSLKTACQEKCDPTAAAITACGDTNVPCLCTNSTMSLISGCEQCMLSELIRTNKPMPDPRAGSTPLLAAFSTACGDKAFNLTVPVIPLAPPADFDGPRDIILSTPAMIVTVGFGGILGVGALYILSNIS